MSAPPPTANPGSAPERGGDLAVKGSRDGGVLGL